jgi:CBS domain-containing protein
MKTVQSILDQKGDEIWSTSPNATVFEALQLMAEKDIGALLVLDGEELVGIFSERDYARKIILKDRSSKSTLVQDVMSYHVLYGSPDLTVEQCLLLMNTKRIRHLPILDGGRLVGIVSIGDVVNALIKDQKTKIADLERYILQHTSIHG